MSDGLPFTLPPQSFFAPMLSFGAAFVGFSVASFLTGCMMVQMYLYFTTNKGSKDSTWLKCLIVAVWIMDFIQLVFQGQYIYSGLVNNFGNLFWFATDTWAFNLSSVMSVFIAICVQMFYARKLYILSDNSLILPGIIAILSIVSFGFGIALLVLVFKIREFAKYSSFTWVVQCWLSLLIAGDVTIVAGMTYHLKTRKTGFKSTDKLIDKLVMLTINTGLAPTVFELAHLIAFTVAGTSFAHICFNFIAPKLYANSFLGTLNARTFIQNESAYDGHSFNAASGGTTTLGGGHSGNRVHVQVHSFADSHELNSFSKPRMADPYGKDDV